MLQVLVIGAGTMGRTHATAYASMPGVKLAGIADIRTEKAQQLADRFGAQAYTSFEAAVAGLGADRMDVIDVCLPTPLHKDYVVKAADIGKHVICEKPLARSEADARFMINYCQDKDVRLFVGHVLRFFPEYVKAKSLLDQGSIGKPAVIRAGRGGGYPVGWNHWYSDFGASGGITLDAMIHDFDYLRWCFGEVERVYAKGLHGRHQAQLDYSLVTLRFRSGVIAHVEGTWAHEGFSMNLEMAGTNGVIDYDSAKDSPLLYKTRSSAAAVPGVVVPESPLERSPYYRELEHFMSCIRDGSEPLVSAEDAYEALRIALAALASMASGEPVVIEDDALTLAST
ncbi:Gfo/Idh/MocA family protein [Paenibacillus sp. MDMC362]|uniref:Gfo/Idh/MocA family protein n=1 Tax=Paenibacillus sp. MDMC362 TaxID=2977365 RepID=UPI000DC23954|nr:Gfo/Idh/MocA family oxidoreductase [Paenibacillus sp. MDMC362]RAR44996.1 gfo/Idh/MocA family oxidoreductase [Paenibacillus sp. MDMC362]